ncbi:hypothetical protein [Sphingomonas sp.]|uniref:hypothetical protein n=1 Tax=Sphingomonas sp. TaxID=28214 RepID=UPI003B3B797A
METIVGDPDPLQPDLANTILLVGLDRGGHWLVQEQGGALEGSFVSRDAALRFARWERHAFAHAVIELSAEPLTPRVTLS